MPPISHSSYKRPSWLFNSHLETIYPAIFRKVSLRAPKPERIDTLDGDFLDLDWYKNDSDHLIVISHGLEGSSDRPYMLGMAKAFLQAGYDVLTWNYRGCGPELNKQVIFYHSGATYDLDRVIDHAQKDYAKISLVGFSLGGNLTLKYLGEERERPSKIVSAVAVSVPLHLASSCEKISKKENFLYSRRFLKSLKEKVMKKSLAYPGEIPTGVLRNIKTLSDFDDFFTGPFHGFADAAEYYSMNSSLFFLEGIQVPSLILNAQNDPFLSPQCYPLQLCRKLDRVWCEFPKQGGHVGFSSGKDAIPYYSEQRAVEFVSKEV
ncbi:YheT family hydrolase [Algoriphagus namhaensis]